MGQMRDADQALRPLITASPKLPSFREAGLISLMKCAVYMMYHEYVTVGHCEYFMNTAGIDVSNVYHSVLPEKKRRRSKLLEEIRIDCVQPQWDVRAQLSNLNKTLQRSFTDTEDIKKSINPPKKGR
ncbi:hypothetical protein TNCV_208331 [Trichonephila clavipes]|uniref:Uncharacterized protein n=1 Tax=Trichonephila clavipes TaxID=2585209 RepID=A0A8X6SVJ9_TRICX|nr:hypothetical protein TNCV_208331 [Trichonephila clavipes]